ncbi:sulfotransferase family 2 domain-containing protein [Catalinimonas sp. 4WD22]|uniref:sulfotransferase family 2 domain-containing protein n=1 Tax=Catalinimonas locisalis TaxID=3133978 RepID=UPI00310116AE
MNLLNRVRKKAIRTFRNVLEDKEVDKIFCPPSVYHYHIRKTAGSSINLAFFDNYVNEDLDEFYQKLTKKYNGRLISNKAIIVGWNDVLINKGKFNYAFSHLPMHQLQLPSHVFKFTCLRDPVKRVVSHYNMLMYYQENDPAHPVFKGEGAWLGNSFEDFLDNLPVHHLKNQLYMFSDILDSSEAFDNIMKLDHIMFTENFTSDLKKLETKLSLQLPLLKIKSYGYKADIPKNSLSLLREKLKDEYLLLEKIKSCLK